MEGWKGGKKQETKMCERRVGKATVVGTRRPGSGEGHFFQHVGVYLGPLPYTTRNAAHRLAAAESGFAAAEAEG